MNSCLCGKTALGCKCSYSQYTPLQCSVCVCKQQVAFLDGLLEKLQGDTRDESSPLYHQLDLARLGVAGHSRGGKLAALHFARAHLPWLLSLKDACAPGALRSAYAA